MISSRFLATLCQPWIPVQAKNVRVLQTPAQFYTTLQAMIDRAKKRIFLSSLYIGSSENDLVRSLHGSLTRNPQLNVHISLDLLRSTRPGPTCTASLLTPLVSAFPDRVHVHLFRSPKLKGLLSYFVPRRFDEGWGTWHAKIYGVDEEVMLSGANLNRSYFTNRQDRYLHFSSSALLSDYCFSFMKLFSTVSYRLEPQTTESDSFTLQWSNPLVEFAGLGPVAKQAIEHLQASYRRRPDFNETDTMVIPMIQAGYINVREEERCMASLFAYIGQLQDAPASIIDMTSGYFALHRPYQQLLIASPAHSRIIAAGPRANGFYGSRGISGRIPEAYTLLERRFWRRVQDACQGSDPNIEFNEWEKENWTYHAKGIWYRPSSLSLPEFTMFGSTNLNSRSANLDTELSFFMITKDTPLQEHLCTEIDLLRQDSRKMDHKDWKLPERRVRFGTRALVAAGIEGML